MLSNKWTVRDFYPIEYIPRGMRLTAYGGDASDDLPSPVLQGFLDAVTAGGAAVPIDQVYDFDQIVEAHSRMEAGQASGKLVVTT
jgi:NADPH:quinone reductase-like Zn-dependent oxidoreductase